LNDFFVLLLVFLLEILFMRKRVNLNCPSHYAVIYTVSGEDPSFPIVWEIVHVLSPNRVSTTPAKWSMGGHTSVVPHNFSSVVH
jgi:hypothetical protein